MASNLKGLSGIKGLLLLHCEKIIIAVAGLLALWFIYSSVQVPHLEEQYQADKLASKVTEINSEVNNFSWEDAVRDHKDKVKIANLTVQKNFSIDPGKYEISPDPFDRPVIAATVRRTDPVMLNAVEVRAIGGSGLFAFTDEQIRKAQEIELKREADEQAKKEEARQKKQQQSAESGRQGRNPEETLNQPMDPDHPNRRQVPGGMAGGTGVMTQAGDRIERAYWATVVAKVPIREQLKLNRDAFDKARLGFDPNRDFPEYIGFRIQRAEVIQGKPLDWKFVPIYDGQHQSIVANKPVHPSAIGTVGKSVVDKLEEAATLYWAGGLGQDVVDQRYTDRNLTLPLPPLVGRGWGSDATHPDIPLAINTPVLEQETPEAVETKPAEPAKLDEGAAFGSDQQGQQPGFGAQNNPEFSRPPIGGGFRPQGGAGPEGGMARMYPRPGGGGPEGGGGRAMGGGSTAFSGPRTDLPRGVDFLLLRFFDFSVEPGKKYKYRVRLVLKDPNYIVEENALAPDVLDRRRKESQAAKASGGSRPYYRLVENWSDPSPTVGIPLAGKVRVASAKLPDPKKVNDEPAVTLLVESFDVDDKGNAVQAAKLKDLRRGGVANMEEEAWYLGPDQTWIDKLDSFKFFTGVTVVDLAGGDKLGKDMTMPVRALLMGPSGELYIRNELDDKPAVDYHKLIFDEKALKRRGKGGPEEQQGVGGPEGGGGRGGPRSP